jgi:acyl dehydratase
MPGKYYEDLNIGDKFRHAQGRTITEMDNVLFCALTMNTQPLHLNEDFAAKTPFGQRIVNGIFTLGLVVGLSVPELTEGTILANLGYEQVKHPNPVFHGDTIYVESEILEKRESRSQPECGIIRIKHTGLKQDGTVVIVFERTALFFKRPQSTVEVSSQ